MVTMDTLRERAPAPFRGEVAGSDAPSCTRPGEKGKGALENRENFSGRVSGILLAESGESHKMEKPGTLARPRPTGAIPLLVLHSGFGPGMEAPRTGASYSLAADTPRNNGHDNACHNCRQDIKQELPHKHHLPCLPLRAWTRGLAARTSSYHSVLS